MGIIKSFEKFKWAESANPCYVVQFDQDFLKTALDLEILIEEIADRLAGAYVAEFGAEILKRIQEKTIESKVIQKVIENLKKELVESSTRVPK